MNYPFCPEEELKDVGKFRPVPKPYGVPSFPVRKFNTPITPKENFLRLARGEKPLWMPNFSVDFNCLQPMVMPDAYARTYGGTDWFGIEWQYEELSRAAMVKPGTRRLSDIVNWEKELVFPNLKAIDWKKDYQEHYADLMEPDRATTFIIVNGCFERLADLTSFEDTFCYLLEEPEAVGDFFEKLTDFHIELFKIAREVYHADAITFHDDMGTQINSFMSPATFREVLLPHYKRMNQAAHNMGLYMILHSCGCVGNQMENFCDAGFDFWEGQDNCNDKTALLKQTTSRMGQVSIFQPPAEMDGEELRQYVENHVKTMAEAGRYMPWVVNTNPGRKVDINEVIYVTSRKLYCGETEEK